MYSGSLIDELTEMVARAEAHAREQQRMQSAAAEPQVEYFAPRYVFEPAQTALIGVA